MGTRMTSLWRQSSTPRPGTGQGCQARLEASASGERGFWQLMNPSGSMGLLPFVLVNPPGAMLTVQFHLRWVIVAILVAVVAVGSRRTRASAHTPGILPRFHAL